jgi:hypothetical protein
MRLFGFSLTQAKKHNDEVRSELGTSAFHRSQVAFVLSSICDRVPFAGWSCGNGTARMPSREKHRKSCQRSQQCTFSGPVAKARNEKLPRFGAIFKDTQSDFSAVQTEWRRGRDSNPRYPLRYAGFQDRCIQPLYHLSELLQFYYSLPSPGSSESNVN